MICNDFLFKKFLILIIGPLFFLFLSSKYLVFQRTKSQLCWFSSIVLRVSILLISAFIFIISFHLHSRLNLLRVFFFPSYLFCFSWTVGSLVFKLSSLTYGFDGSTFFYKHSICGIQHILICHIFIFIQCKMLFNSIGISFLTQSLFLNELLTWGFSSDYFCLFIFSLILLCKRTWFGSFKICWDLWPWKLSILIKFGIDELRTSIFSR